MGVPKRTLFRFLLVVFVGFMVCLTSDDVLATGKVRAEGMLTSIEGDGSVVIDEKGYEVSPTARIIDRKGRRVSLHSLSLPTRVSFEYEYTEKGFVIKLLEEYPEVVPK